MRLLHKPHTLATRATEVAMQMPPKQTHEVVSEERGSEDEDEWEIDSSASDIEEIDDIIPVLTSDN